MPTITFIPSTEGTGATTSAIILAVTLARRNKVVLLDVVPEGHLETWARRAEQPRRLKVQTSRGERYVQDEIQTAAMASDFVVVDLQAGASRLNSFAIAESDLVIIPARPTEQDVERAIEAWHQTKLDTRIARRNIPTKILFVRTDSENPGPFDVLNDQEVELLSYALVSSPAYSSIYELGGGLYRPAAEQLADASRAIGNAELFTEEVLEVLGLPQGVPPQRDSSPIEPRHRRSSANDHKTVQMSVRMTVADYERFRALCGRERRTNGDMVNRLLKQYALSSN